MHSAKREWRYLVQQSRTKLENVYLRNRPKGDRINSARLLLKFRSRKGRDLSWPRFQIIFVSRREKLRYLMRIFFYLFSLFHVAIFVSFITAKYIGLTQSSRLLTVEISSIEHIISRNVPSNTLVTKDFRTRISIAYSSMRNPRVDISIILLDTKTNKSKLSLENFTLSITLTF